MKLEELNRIIREELNNIAKNPDVIEADTGGKDNCKCGDACKGAHNCYKCCANIRPSKVTKGDERFTDREYPMDDEDMVGQVRGGGCKKRCCNDDCSESCTGNATAGCDCCGKGRSRSDRGISIRENNKLNKKKMLNERFQELAGIKPLYEKETEETTKEYSYEEMKDMMMNEQGEIINEQLFAAIGGIVALLGTAGITASIEMALEDPAIAEKYPKLKKVFEFLQDIGGAAGQAKRG